MKRIILTCAISSLCLALVAQTKANGTLTLNGGIGTATPWGVDARANIKTGSLTLNPFLNFKGISNKSSEMQQDVSYAYTGIRPLSTSKDSTYTSLEKIKKTGLEIAYGLQAKYDINSRNSIEASFKGENLDVHEEGTLKENLFHKSALMSSTNWMIDNSLMVERAWETEAKYSFTDLKHKRFFRLGYSYQRNTEDEEKYMDAIELMNFTEFQNSTIKADATIQHHNLQADWEKHFNAHQLDFGARYENRLIKSNDLQWLDEKQVLEDHFRHQYQTAGIFANYRWGNKYLKANARLEYDYTDMEGNNLHDLIPQAAVEWTINPEQNLKASYVRRIIRPTLAYLNPAEIRGAYTLDKGNEELLGTHINNVSLVYQLKRKIANFSTTLSHIFVNDGFNAIWMEKKGMRISTWGNEGVRRAWSITPSVVLSPTITTTIDARATLIWDKREAYAIHMAKEHWGITTHLGVKQQIAGGTSISVMGDYSEGNTIDLYSHAGRSYSAGANVEHNFGKFCTATLDYRYTEYAKTILTQGAYVGSVFLRPANHNQASLTLQFHL